MGKKQFNAVLESNPFATDIKNMARFILCVLADRAAYKEPELGYCYPSYNWIIKRTGCSKKTVKRSVNKLQQYGHLIVRNKDEGETLTNHYLVTTGLLDNEIQMTLQSRFDQTAESAKQIVTEMRLRQEKKSEIDDENLSFFSHSRTKCLGGGDILSKGGDILSGGWRQNVPQYDSDTLANTLTNTLAREDALASELENNFNSKNDMLQDQPLSAKNKANHIANKSTKKENNLAQPPTPHSAAPPPPDKEQAMLEAVREACGMGAAKNRNQKKRIKRRLGGAANALITSGYTTNDVAIMREWWDVVGIGSRGGTPPQPSQIESYIDTAIAWKQGSSGPRNEYEYATGSQIVKPISKVESLPDKPKVFRSRSYS